MSSARSALLVRQWASAALVGVRSWGQERRLRLAAAFSVALAIPLAGLLYQGFRSLSALEEAWTTVLRQTSRQAVDEVAAQIDEGFRKSYTEVLNLARVPADVPAADLPLMASILEKALQKDPLVDRFYFWTESFSPRAGRLLMYGRGQTEFVSDVPDGPRLLAAVHKLAKEWRETARLEQGGDGLRIYFYFVGRTYTNTYHTALFELDVDGRRMYFVARMYFASRPARAFSFDEAPALDTRLASFVAFSIDDKTLRRRYIPSLLAPFSHSNVPLGGGLPPLKLTVTDDGGEVVFPTNGPVPRVFVEERSIPLAFTRLRPDELERNGNLYAERLPVWHIRSTYGDQTISEIVASRVRSMRATLIALGALILLCVLIVGAAAVREIRLAELKSSFVASVSHDLKTPLSLIRLFAESVELGRVNDTRQVRKYASMISTQALNLARLVDNVLDFSRIEAGLRQYELARHDLGELTAGVLASMATYFEQQEFAVTSHIASALRPVNIDSVAVRRALENVLLNAVKYSGTARRIDVHVDEANGYGRVRVTDYGIGIPPALQRKIFSKFYRIHSGASSGAQGRGLGLSIVDHVVRAHGGGFITVDSSPGQGSTFALHFPVSTEVAGVETNPGDRG